MLRILVSTAAIALGLTMAACQSSHMASDADSRYDSRWGTRSADRNTSGQTDMDRRGSNVNNNTGTSGTGTSGGTATEGLR